MEFNTIILYPDSTPQKCSDFQLFHLFNNFKNHYKWTMVKTLTVLAAANQKEGNTFQHLRESKQALPHILAFPISRSL